MNLTDPTHMWITGFGMTNVPADEAKEEPVDKRYKIEKKDPEDWLTLSETLRKAFVSAMPNTKCQLMMDKAKQFSDGSFPGRTIGGGQLCGKDMPTKIKKSDTCQGDSGGPMSFEVDFCKVKHPEAGKGLSKRALGKTWEAKKLRKKCVLESSASKNMQYQQYGITSFGYGCGETMIPGMYTRVSYYMDWIIENTKIDGVSYLQYPDLSNF